MCSSVFRDIFVDQRCFFPGFQNQSFLGQIITSVWLSQLSSFYDWFHTFRFFGHLIYNFFATTQQFYHLTNKFKMYAARAAKPKLSLSISAAQNVSSRPSLSLRSPGHASLMPRTPISPSPISPVTSRRDHSSMLQPSSYAYTNSCTSKSILKKQKHHVSSSGKRIQFENNPTVYCVTPIENKEEYYGGYVKLSRDERRWGAR